jgi:hypothetical protein
MRGGAANDVYFVDNTGDVVVENTGKGLDTIRASLSFTLAANVENLVLIGGGNINGNVSPWPPSLLKRRSRRH